MGKDVNCVLLPLNCLLVVLITVVIDAEIKLVATGAEGSELKSGTWMKDYHSKHMKIALL